MRGKFAKQIDATVFPGVQGGPLMHVIAAKAVCFHEALQPQFREYQRQVVVNAKALAAGLTKHGFRITSGGTDNHLMLVDLRPKELNGKEAQEVLDRAGIRYVYHESGGGHTWENLVAACQTCNHRKGGKTLDETRLRLVRAPFEPRSDVYSLFTPYLMDDRNEAWRDYLFLGRN